MKMRGLIAVAGAVALLPLAGKASAQVHISPLVGVYTQANSLDQLRAQADTLSIKRESAMSLGANLEAGFLRATINYVSGATIKQKSGTSLSASGDLGKGKILMGALDAVLRPIPRIVVVQPYALAGIGFKKFDYDLNNTTLSGVRSNSTAAFHAGLGADVMFGGLGILAEVTDYVSQGQPQANGDRQLQHDAYGMIGLRLGL